MAVGLAALAGCSSNNSGNGNGNGVTCGDGTTLVGNQCVAGSGGSGGSGDVTCGSGTVLDGDTCVVAPNDAAAPTITMITPSEVGAYGHQPFEIDGTGFAGDNVTDLHVYFGDPTLVDSSGNSICEAFAVVASPTAIGGEMPAMCDVNVQVSVVTNLGSATVPFRYDAIFAADGDGGGQGYDWTGNPADGELWVVDPYVGMSLDYGPLMQTITGSDGSATAVPFGALAGIAFDGSGTLWGVTTGDSDADFPSGTVADYSTLVTIDLQDPSGYPMVTPVGSAFDGSGNQYYISDIEWNAGTLYGLSINTSNNAQRLVTIGSNGLVTRLGSGSAATWTRDWDLFAQAQGGLAFDGSGTLWVAPSGAGSDSSDGATGALDTANTTTGALTKTATLDWGEGSDGTGLGVPVSAMTNDEGYLYAVLDNGSYGQFQTSIGNTPVDEFYGETLAVIDPTGSGGYYVYPQFELPAVVSKSSAVDGIAVLQSTTATLQIAHEKVARAASWQALKLHAGAAITRRVRH